MSSRSVQSLMGKVHLPGPVTFVVGLTVAWLSKSAGTEVILQTEELINSQHNEVTTTRTTWVSVMRVTMASMTFSPLVGYGFLMCWNSHALSVLVDSRVAFLRRTSSPDDIALYLNITIIIITITTTYDFQVRQWLRGRVRTCNREVPAGLPHLEWSGTLTWMPPKKNFIKPQYNNSINTQHCGLWQVARKDKCPSRWPP